MLSQAIKSASVPRTPSAAPIPPTFAQYFPRSPVLTQTPDTPATPPADAASESASPLKDTITFDDFVKLDLRVATIVEAEAHPNADRLLKLQVDLGFEKRQICAGVKAFYDPADLVGKQIVVVANLAPRKIRGEISNGMLMAASHMALENPAPDSEGEVKEVLKDVVLLTPSKPVPAGSTVG